MKIKLKESIHLELTALGLRPGMEIESNDVNKITGAVQFTTWYKSFSYNCVVWPVDYEIVTEEKTATIPISQTGFVPKNDIPNQITLPIAELTNALDAMHWCFFLFLDNPDLSEFPWIVNLIKSYNDIVKTLPSPWDLQYETIKNY